MGRIRFRDTNLAEAVVTGLTWKVYNWRVRVWYPSLPDLLGSARGMAASTLRKQGEMDGAIEVAHELSLDEGPRCRRRPRMAYCQGEPHED